MGMTVQMVSIKPKVTHISPLEQYQYCQRYKLFDSINFVFKNKQSERSFYNVLPVTVPTPEGQHFNLFCSLLRFNVHSLRPTVRFLESKLMSCELTRLQYLSAQA
jgi:hypothetical protein